MQRMPPCHIEPPGLVRTSAGIVIGRHFEPRRPPSYACPIEVRDCTRRRRSQNRRTLRDLSMCLLAVALLGLAIVAR